MADKFQTKADEQEMFKTCSSEEIRNTLIVNNIKLVYKLAHKYANRYVVFDDLQSRGMEALHKSVDTFDPSRNTKFTTFAFFYIRKYIIDYINLERRQKTISDDRLTPTVSLDTPVYDSETMTLGSIVTEAPDQHINIIEQDEAEFMRFLVEEFLTLREQFVVRNRYLAEKAWPFSLIAKNLDISIISAKKLETLALQKLRKLYDIFNNGINER